MWNAKKLFIKKSKGFNFQNSEKAFRIKSFDSLPDSFLTQGKQTSYYFFLFCVCYKIAFKFCHTFLFTIRSHIDTGRKLTFCHTLLQIKINKQNDS